MDPAILPTPPRSPDRLDLLHISPMPLLWLVDQSSYGFAPAGGCQNMKYLIALGCVAALGLAGQGAGAQDIRTERVHFPGGQNGTTITGKITGYASVSYIVGAEAGQTLTVALNPSNGATYFNVYGPGKAPGDEALANAQLTGPMVPDLNRFSGKLPASGEYTISVYMMRSAARRDESSDYTLDIAIAGSDAAALDEPVRNDYADGLAGGPDYWEVNIGEVSGQLNLRAAPSQSAAILKSVADGTILRNQGCRMAEGRRWCRVETLDNAAVSGWVAGDFLSEGSYTEAPAAASAAKREPTTKTERVQFPRGATQTQLKGRLSGGDAVN
jgi:hypothetical protein